MAKNSSNKSRYPSRYSPGGWVSAPQYVTELICESKARQDKKDLPRKFWEDKDWEKYFKHIEFADPEKVGDYASTKGSYDGKFADDRTVLILHSKTQT